MFARSRGAVLVGIDARLIDVEVDLGGGLPVISAVGLPDNAVREGVDRIRSALRHAGFTLPQRRVTINLAPAEVRKQGAALDLPIAMAMLQADGQLGPLPDGDRLLAVGELALDGAVRPVRGAMSLALAAEAAGLRGVIVPDANADEAALVSGVDVIPVSRLEDLAALAAGRRRPRPLVDLGQVIAAATDPPPAFDLAAVRGQAAARRALEIAAAGGHHLLMSGPPGSGKTLLARALPGILPPLEPEQALEATRVWSAAGQGQGLVTRTPFRAPHHTVSFAGMTGGGVRLRPGEISLASYGVLYLDELAEFRRDALEALRQPLESGEITVVRLSGAATFPATFTLVASMNPCPCGQLGAGEAACTCTPGQRRQYRGRLSGPLLDRFDLTVELPAVAARELDGRASGESSSDVRRRVVDARRLQRQRFGGRSLNGRMGPAELEAHVRLGGRARAMLVEAVERLRLSARGFDRVRRVARTIADLAGDDAVETGHVAEAIRYRRPDLLEPR